MHGMSRRPARVRFGLTILSLALTSAVAFGQDKNSKSPANPKPTSTPNPAATPKQTATQNPSPTPETKIDPKTEAELLQAEDRFINAILNRDVKALDELLHPGYADSFAGAEKAINKRGTLARLTGGAVAAYRIDNERKLTRSGNSFTIEGVAIDFARDGTDDRPNKPVHVTRLWERQGDRWIATAQEIAPEKESEEKKRELR